MGYREGIELTQYLETRNTAADCGSLRIFLYLNEYAEHYKQLVSSFLSIERFNLLSPFTLQ
jgi:hypothetical protein